MDRRKASCVSTFFNLWNECGIVSTGNLAGQFSDGVPAHPIRDDKEMSPRPPGLFVLGHPHGGAILIVLALKADVAQRRVFDFLLQSMDDSRRLNAEAAASGRGPAHCF